MKANRLRWVPLLLLVAAVSHSPAQQTDADPKQVLSDAERKLIADARAEAEKGNAESQFYLGSVFSSGGLTGVVVAKDQVEALKWYRKAADGNLAIAQWRLGVCYALAEGVPKDNVEAVKWYRKAAKQNLPIAEWSLGDCYADGQGVPKDDAEAVKWYRKAAERNFPDAQYRLGDCFATGQGVVKDEVEAVRWYRKAAEGNNADAQNTLGACYHDGRGVAKDYVEAAKWYRKAADQNNALGQFNLGVSYATGRGLTEDVAEAAKWYRKAADQNNAMAQFNLGFCYANGEGVLKDDVEAVKWYRKAADQNNALGQFNLGACYANGRGVAKDYVEAYKWFLLATARGDELARKAVTRLENRMTREQIAEGQEAAHTFKPLDHPPAGPDGSNTRIAQIRPEFSGTGFFITEDGYLITSEHVVGDGAQVRLVTEAGVISARVVKVDAANDLALLKVWWNLPPGFVLDSDSHFHPLPVVSSRAMRLGSTVATVGFPNIVLQGFAPKLAKGEIAALSGAQDDPRYFVSSAESVG